MSRLLVSLLFLLPAAFAAPQPLAPRASAGCGKFQLLRGVTVPRTFKSGTKDRGYSIHTPSSYDSKKAYPIVIGFHGSDSIGLFFEVDTKLDDAKYSGEKIMVYPNGIDGAWAGPSYATTTVEEDLKFVDDLIADVSANYCVDDKKIYGTGMSNGGGFIGTIACSAVGGKFAALAAGSGSFYTDVNGPPCQPARSPLPLLEIHGGNDKSVPYNGGTGEGGALPSITSWLDSWVQRNGCSNKQQEDTFNGDVHHLTWTCNGQAGALQHWKVDSMGHAWASTEINFSQLAAGEGPTKIQAAEIIMKFFDGFTKPDDTENVDDGGDTSGNGSTNATTATSSTTTVSSPTPSTIASNITLSNPAWREEPGFSWLLGAILGIAILL